MLKLYLALLVLVTQRLALVRDLRTQQTLTAIHDKTSAWLGLGSSLATLVDQVKVPATVSGVLFIVLYLAGIAVLHVVIPAAISVNVYNATMQTLQQTHLSNMIFRKSQCVTLNSLDN